MQTTDLGACEWFVWDLRRSSLIERGPLDELIGEFLGKNPGAEPPALAEFLIGRGVLTAFQAERLLQGKTQGFVLGPFTLTDALGAGSMGTVYKAVSKTDSRWYAVKVLPRRSMWNVRLARRKVRLFEQCQHPAVVPFVDVGTSGGMHYLAWPFIEGSPLDKLVEQQGPMAPEQAIAYLLQAAEGLEVCHRQGIIHGLIKPSNLLVGADEQLRILDFGIGCLLAETEGESLVDTMSTANSVNSGLDCASPESIMDPSNLTPAGDQYSLGCVLYFCLSGRYPFPDGTAVEKMMAHQHKQPTPILHLNPHTPDGIVAVLERLMQKSPLDRFPSCENLIEELRSLAAPQATVMARRPTMTIPRVRLQRPSDAPVAPSSAASERPRPRTIAPAAPERPARLERPSAPPARPERPSAPPARPERPSAPPARPERPTAPPARLGRPGTAPAAGGPARPSVAPSAPPPVAPPSSLAADETEEGTFTDVQPRLSLGQRLGTPGVILVAALAGIAAYALSYVISTHF